MVVEEIKYESIISKNKFNQISQQNRFYFINCLKNEIDLRFIYTKIDKYNRLHGDQLFPLTILINNGAIYYNSVTTFNTNKELDRSQFVNLCMELENFITFTNWLSNDERYKLNQEIKKNRNEKENIILTLYKNYLIGDKKENYATITPFYSEYNIKTTDNLFYNWEYVPYIKRSSETFITYFNPAFTVNTTKNNLKVYSNYFSAIFKYEYSENDLIKIKILNHFLHKNNLFKYIEVYAKNDLIKKLKQSDTNKYMIGLFCDEIKKYDSKDYIRNIKLIEVKEDTLEQDILHHKIIQRIYYSYLLNDNLLICDNIDKIKDIFIKESQILTKYLKLDQKITFEQYYDIYLKKYIFEYKSKVYYKPYLLKNYTDNEIDEIYDCYNNIDNCNGKFIKIIFNIKFIQIYNKSNKYVLINRISKWDYKWKII